MSGDDEIERGGETAERRAGRRSSTAESIAASGAPLVRRRRRPWRPTPLLRGAGAWHAAVLAWAAGAALRRPRDAAPILSRAMGRIVASHAVLFGASVLPRASLVGTAVTRLPAASIGRGEVALTFDDGPDPRITPRVLDRLDAAGARASFFAIGDRAARHPELAAEIVRRGHRLENHTAHHRATFAFHAGRRLAAEIEGAQTTLTAIAGRPPAWFRPPAGMRNPLLHRHLARLGLRYASWTRRGFDTTDGDPRRVLRRLVRGLGAGDILLLHDGGSAVGQYEGGGEPVVLEVLPRLLEVFERRGLRAVPIPDPEPSGSEPWPDP